MFLNFEKESLLFIDDNQINQTENFTSDDAKKLLKIDNLSQFLSEFQFIIYYIEPSKCNNIVYLENNFYHQKLIEKFFPQINFFYNYEEDLKNLKENDQNYAIISNINQEEMGFQENLVKRYEPYAALLDFKYEGFMYKDTYKYLDGLLLKKLFSTQPFELKLLVRGIGYREWDTKNICKKMLDFQKKKIDQKFFNPISDDNKTIFKERGFYNTFDETAMTVIIMDYLKKINQDINFNNIIKILKYILDNLEKDKSLNLDIAYIIS